jgi:hypothetical protein
VGGGDESHCLSAAGSAHQRRGDFGAVRSSRECLRPRRRCPDRTWEALPAGIDLKPRNVMAGIRKLHPTSIFVKVALREQFPPGPGRLHRQGDHEPGPGTPGGPREDG